MDIKNIYKQLTDVDIEQQRAIWDDRGKGYYGEFLLFCELYRILTGNGKILMNLNVPISNSKTTEIDLILIHETGLYVFEIKHYKGTIYGKDTDKVWTQYFRTVKNNTFANPIKQNEYHIEALKKLFPNVPIYSCIVFTNYNCDIRVTKTNSTIDVFKLSNIYHVLEYRFTKNEQRYSMEEIDCIFEKLSPFSKMQKSVTINGEEANFLSWIQPTISKLDEKKKEIESEKSKLAETTKKLKKSRIIGIVFNVIIAVICVVLTFTTSFLIIHKNNMEIAKFKQNFMHVDEINNIYIDALDSYVNISKVSLLPLSDDAVSFTARIATTNDIYGISFTRNSRYIVMTNSGKVFEYNLFGENMFYSKLDNTIGKGIRDFKDLTKVQFYGISNPKEISYIKITDVELFKLDIGRSTIKDGLEIELYSK